MITELQRLAKLIFPEIDKTPEDYENIYPPRMLPDGARVTRIAPSPTGYLHLGTLFASLCDRRVADMTNGVFYLRVEDTDKKREMQGGVSDIVTGLKTFGISPDEGVTDDGSETGDYGPYTQSKRSEIYHSYVKRLIENGLAYPCFCTEEELTKTRNEQEQQKLRTGYYTHYAKCRTLTVEESIKKVENKVPFVIRLMSPGNENAKISFDDGIKGKIEMPENDQDIVLLKTDMIPTYHFAHAVDDYLMRTTHVIRGDEWLSSTPVHLQLFKILGHKVPKYAHISPIMKEDTETGGKRKLSKRKDPEAAVAYLAEQGYPAESVIEYLLTIANSDFEDWRRANQNASSNEFKFNLKKMSVSGALFDLNKLNDVSKNVISKMTADTVFGKTLKWAEQHDNEFYCLLSSNADFAKAIFSIDRNVPKPRKDIAKWNEVKNYCAYFYDEFYTEPDSFPLPNEDVNAVLTAYLEVYNSADDHTEWFSKIKGICEPLGFSPDIKAYKKSPESFKGHVGDVSNIIRIAVTSRANSPDLYAIMSLLGENRVTKRLKTHLQ